MPKFKVLISERVFYEPVIVDAKDEEDAEIIARDLQPYHLKDDEGEEYAAEITEATADEIEHLKEVDPDSDPRGGVLDVVVNGGTVIDVMNVPEHIIVRVIDEDEGRTTCYAGENGNVVDDPLPDEDAR